ALTDGCARGIYSGGIDPGEPVSPPGPDHASDCPGAVRSDPGADDRSGVRRTHGGSLGDSRRFLGIEWAGPPGRWQYAPDVSRVTSLDAAATPTTHGRDQDALARHPRDSRFYADPRGAVRGHLRPAELSAAHSFFCGGYRLGAGDGGVRDQPD